MKNFKAFVMILLCAICANVASAASTPNYQKKLKKAKGIEMTFQSVSQGHVSPVKTLVAISGDQCAVSTILPDGAPASDLSTGTYVDYAANKYYRRAEKKGKAPFASVTDFVLDKGFTDQGEDVILGLKCKIVRTMINSNTIDVWYTTEVPFRGTPQPNVGVPAGLVLKVARNGQYIQEAIDIAPVKEEANLFPATWGDLMDASDYSFRINNIDVITVPIFDQDRIAFNGAALPDGELKANTLYTAGGGTIIMKKVKLPDSVDERKVFVEVVQYSDGDAYDRTGSVFIIPTEKEQSFIHAMRDLKSVPAFRSGNEDYHGLVSTPKYDVPLELMRFFTGFGVRKFNHNKVPGQAWVDSVLYKTEVTPVADHLAGEVWVCAYIGNWDKNGHKVSVKLKYYPSEERHKERVAGKTMPLFNTVNYLEQAGQPYPIFVLNDKLNVKFTLKEPIKNAQLFFLTTGHGGWGGGDEFNQKPNTIYLDGEKVITFIPWRDDCGTSRNNNPCSGNFSNGLSSSDLSRSNWCPGTVTNPNYIALGDLDAGDHTIVVQIPQGAPEGGANSYWCLSGTLIW